MKKISLLLMLVIAGWSLTACDESFNDYPMPPVYEQEPLITVEGFEATTTPEATQNNPGQAAGNAVNIYQVTYKL